MPDPNILFQTHRFLALYNESPDIGGVPGANGGVVLVGDNTLGISIAAHEVLHTLGEPHSRLASDTAPRPCILAPSGRS